MQYMYVYILCLYIYTYIYNHIYVYTHIWHIHTHHLQNDSLSWVRGLLDRPPNEDSTINQVWLWNTNNADRTDKLWLVDGWFVAVGWFYTTQLLGDCTYDGNLYQRNPDTPQVNTSEYLPVIWPVNRKWFESSFKYPQSWEFLPDEVAIKCGRVTCGDGFKR